MIYVLIAINILWLLMVTGFVFWALGKGVVVINYNHVLDKETSMKVAKKMEEQFDQEVNSYNY